MHATPHQPPGFGSSRGGARLLDIGLHQGLRRVALLGWVGLISKVCFQQMPPTQPAYPKRKSPNPSGMISKRAQIVDPRFRSRLRGGKAGARPATTTWDYLGTLQRIIRLLGPRLLECRSIAASRRLEPPHHYFFIRGVVVRERPSRLVRKRKN